MRSCACFALLLAATPLSRADPMLVYTVTDFIFDDSRGFRTGGGAPMSVIGLDTPHNADTTIHGVIGGFNWNPGLVGSDANNWELGGTDIIIEAGFFFNAPDLAADIAPFFYGPPGGTPPFDMPKGGSQLSFTTGVFIGIDPRLAAFYGLGPPCVDTSFRTSCQVNLAYTAIFAGNGTAIAGDPGVYRFTGQITADFVPEPSSVALLATVVGALGFAARWRAKARTRGNASA